MIGGSFPPSDNGSIKVVGKRVYVVSESGRKSDRTFYIYSDAEKRPDEAMDLVSNTLLPTNRYPYDIEISGQYAYIYAEDSAANRSTILTYDISDASSPLLLEPYETFASATGNGLPSKMTMVGDRIYTVATANLTVAPGIRSVKIDGINSPAAKIGNIQAKDIKVANNLSISQALQVGRSATIGSGGLWVDKGEGIRTDSRINVNISSLFENALVNNLGGLNITSRGITETDSDEYTNPQLTGTSVKFLNSVVQTSGSLGSVRGHLVQMDDLETPDLKAIEIQLESITSANDIYGIYINVVAPTVTGDVVGLHIDGVDRNFIEGQFDTPDVQTDLTSPLQIASVPNQDTISSGYYEMDPAGTDFNDGGLNWIRIGNIVHAKGWIRQISGSTTPTGNLPHDNCKATSTVSFLKDGLGTATTFQSTTSTIQQELGVYLPGGSTNQFTINGTHGTLFYYIDITYEVI
jgi:hypothetical protein